MRLLVVTAVDAERDAILAALDPAALDPAAPHQDGPHRVVTVGVGPAAAAAGTSAELASHPVDVVVSAGIGGGFVPLSVGDIAVASSVVFADLGAETPDGFAPASSLGFGTDTYDVEPALAVALADRTGGHLGTVLTVATVTGTQATADRLAGRFPGAVAEAMEGAGVAAAAARHGVAFAEIRAVSNRVGPRDREAWRIPDALTALGAAVAAVLNIEP